MLTGKPTLARALLGSLLLALAIIPVHAAFWLFLPRGIASHDWFSWDLKLTLVFFESTMTVLVVTAVALSTLAAGRRLPDFAAGLLGVVLLWIAMVFLLASWLFFGATGDFLGVQALAMWWRNFTQMGQHILHFAPRLTLLLPLVALGLALVLFAGMRLLRRISEEGVAKGAKVGWAICVLALLIALLWPAIRVPDDRRNAYGHARWQTSGPAAYFVSSIGQALSGSRVAKVPDWAEVFLRRPERQPLAHYLAGVDREGIRHRNVVVLLVESLRPDALSTFEGDRHIMPTIDHLAREGLRYRRAYTQATHSNYADLVPLSSHYPLRSQDAYIYPSQYTYPRVLIYDVLQQLGWRTAIFSSQDERWGSMLNYLDTGGLDHIVHAGNYEGPSYVPRFDTGLTDWMMGNRRAGKIDDRFTVSEAIRWTGNGDDRPFFIYMNLQTSHFPFEVPADFDAPYDLPAGIRGLTFEQDAMRILGDKELTREEFIDILRIRYFNSLAYVDRQFGRLVDALESRGELEQTIFVISADTGFAFDRPGTLGYGLIPWEEVVRVPLIIRAPGVASREDKGVAEHLDVAPTVFSLLGLPEYAGFQGEDLLAVPEESRSPAFILTQTPIGNAMSVIHGRWKYIYDSDARRPMLFNLALDPRERHNLVSERQELFYELDTLIALWRRAQLDYYRDQQRHAREFPPRFTPGLSLDALGRTNREAQ